MSKSKKKSVTVYDEMHPVGVFLWWTGCIRMHADGNSISYYCRWYHPFTWLLLIVMVIPCALMGEKLTAVVPLRLKPFWVENSDQLQWVRPWTRLSDIKPFKFNLAKAKREAREAREAQQAQEAASLAG